MTEDEIYMKRAIDIAWGGLGKVDPNPLVGAVVVKDGEIIAEGFHQEIGHFHAERNALTFCPDDLAEGADLYVTLEPCCHTGKTPPCTDIIIKKKIRRVFVGAMDVNPLVAGKGVSILREHGIEVHTGILEKECLKQNEVFFHHMSTKTPFVVSKFAETLDGKIATVTGDSRWISSEESRAFTHFERMQYVGIMAGIGTVLADDPMLNCRLADIIGELEDSRVERKGYVSDSDEDEYAKYAELLKDDAVLPEPDWREIISSAGFRKNHLKAFTEYKDQNLLTVSQSMPLTSDSYSFRNPVRIICDSHLRISVDCNLVKTAKEIPTIVACLGKYDSDSSEGDGMPSSKEGDREFTFEDSNEKNVSSKIEALKAAGVEIIFLPEGSDGHIDLRVLMTELYKRNITSILLEGGGELHFAALKAGIVNKIEAFIAPKIVGGSSAKSPVEGEGISALKDAFELANMSVQKMGEDILVTADVDH